MLLREESAPLPTFKMLTVIQPESPDPDWSDLPGTADELHRIETHIPADNLIRLGGPNPAPTADRVFSQLSDVSIVHLACHGMQDPADALNSAFILSDGRLTIARIMQHSVAGRALAFLSACETASGESNLPDENMHLAASMLFAGFRGVVATLW